MAKLTPAEAAQKFARNAAAAAPDWQAGIERVTESPTVKAAEQIPKMRAKLLAAIDSGKVERGLRRVSLSDWRSATIEKGASRYPQGVAAAEGKVKSFMEEWLPHMDAVSTEIAAMPNLTIEDSIARVTKQIRHAHNFVRK